MGRIFFALRTAKNYLCSMKNRITALFIFSFFLCCVSNAQVNFIRQQNVPVQVGANNLVLPWAGGLSYPMFSEFDFNLDGIMDIFVNDRANYRIVPFINGGTPNQVDYTYAPEYTNFFPPLWQWAFTYDFDCDGKKDFFTLSDFNNGIKVYRNISTTPGTLQFTLFSPVLMSQYPSTYTNMFASYGLIPAFSDVDNDGDTDILCWNNAWAGMVEYNKNKSVENGFGCDSMQFQWITSCWGEFSLVTNANQAQLGITCRMGFFSAEEPFKNYDPSDAARNDDTMSSICIIDMESDGDKDLLIGGLADKNSLFLTNGGTPTVASMTSQDTLFPSYDNPAQVISFTTHAYIDVDNDGKKDLIVSPTFEEDFSGIWFYKNTGSTAVPVFNYQINNFLQRDMIETGSGAYPAFFDYDVDGLTDMVVGNYTYYQPTGGFKSGLSLYRNIGTTAAPSFQLITRDYAGLFSYTFAIGYGNDVHPAFGDVDGDGDLDMMVGDYNGKIQFFTNTAPIGNPANFSFTGPNYQNIDIGANAAPQLIDLDRDGKLDLVIGRKNGFISYYQNTGTTTNPIFTLTEDSLGDVDVSNLSNGYASPFVFDDSGAYKMLVGNELGYVFLYGNIDNNLNGTFTLLDTVLSRTEGNRVNIGMGDINGDTLMDLLVGNYSGGVALFYRDNPLATHFPFPAAAKPSFEVFPNPATGSAVVQFSNLNPAAKTLLSIFNATGEKVYTTACAAHSQTLNISSLSSGLYILRLHDGQNSLVRKLVVY